MIGSNKVAVSAFRKAAKATEAAGDGEEADRGVPGDEQGRRRREFGASSTRRWKTTSRTSGAERASRFGWSRPAARTSSSSTSRASESMNRLRDGPRDVLAGRRTGPARRPTPTAPSMSIRPSGLSAVALAIGLLLGSPGVSRPPHGHSDQLGTRCPGWRPRLVRGRDRRRRADVHPRLRADRQVLHAAGRCTAAGRCSTPTATAGSTSCSCKGPARTPGSATGSTSRRRTASSGTPRPAAGSTSTGTTWGWRSGTWTTTAGRTC